MMDIYYTNHGMLENQPLKGPTAVICIADSQEQLARIHEQTDVKKRLDLIFHDTTASMPNIVSPSEIHAARILEFVQQVEAEGIPSLCVQCQCGIGRSQGIVAALKRIRGEDDKEIRHRGTYNRKIYQRLLEAARIPAPREPLVSMTVRVKYAPDRLQLFILAMQRQRYENWEMIAVTDGFNSAAFTMLNSFRDSRLRIIQTNAVKGHWGHPWRQKGLDNCRGEFICMSNDDNYIAPGFLEALVNALDNADLALCQCVHSYYGWGVVEEPGHELGAWMARAHVVRKVKWDGDDHVADQRYVAAMKSFVGVGRIAEIRRPLFVHN